MVSGTLRGLGAFRVVMRSGLRWDAGFLRSYLLVERSVQTSFRVGISVSAKDFTAVQRNRLRRLVREGVRRQKPAVCAALAGASSRADMVVQVRRDVDPRRVRLSDVEPLMAQLTKRLIRLAALETP
jgi:ribonuclease P protein component